MIEELNSDFSFQTEVLPFLVTGPLSVSVILQTFVSVALPYLLVSTFTDIVNGACVDSDEPREFLSC